MKKFLLQGFLILFILSATALPGFSDPKNESEKPASTSPKENKLSDEELSRMSKRAETDNLSDLNLVNKEKNNSKNDLKAPNQIYVENRHHGYYYGGAGLILLIILLVVLL
jgi:hypothetical protein